MWLDKPFVVEVLERIGPITIDDFNIINDQNETKIFNIRFAKMGVKTCISVDYGDGTPALFFGNLDSCKLRFPHLTEVGFVDPVAKTFDLNHTYIVRGLYQVTVTGFDERNYAEESLGVTIFKMPCKVPQVWLPENQTSWLRPEMIPKSIKSKPLQVASMSVLECNRTVETSMLWTAYKVFSIFPLPHIFSFFLLFYHCYNIGGDQEGPRIAGRSCRGVDRDPDQRHSPHVLIFDIDYDDIIFIIIIIKD